MVNWNFLMVILKRMSFNLKLIDCIKGWITTSFLVCINEEFKRFFKSSKGLRQGDSIFPYLFVLVIEDFSHILSKMSKDERFKYHWKCQEVDIIHLCFVNDLLIFYKVNKGTITIIKQTLKTFNKWLALKANNSKSYIFLSIVPQVEKKNHIELFSI